MIYVPHTTAAVTINESADPSVKSDILMILNQIIPWEANYRHLEGNSPAHIKSTLVGSSAGRISRPSLAVTMPGSQPPSLWQPGAATLRRRFANVLLRR